MLKNEDIICISSIDWDFLWQGHQEVMTRLARNGNRVLFIENTGVRAPRISDIGRIRKRIANWKRGVRGIRKIEDSLYVYSPLVFPFPYLKIARLINNRLIFSVLFRWLKTVGFTEPLVWAFLPTGLTLDLIAKIEPKVLIYYCIDSFQASSKDARKVKRTEELLLKKADLVFVTSEELSRYCRQHSQQVYYFPFGVDIEKFKQAMEKGTTVPDDIKNIKKPIAGYIGGIHKWIDFDLVRYIATKNKDISFVFCGPIQVDVTGVSDIANITFLGQKKPEELPAYVKSFDAALIPYRLAEYTKNVYPTKLNEYLSVGKAVISTSLPEVLKFNNENGGIVRVAATRDDFVRNVREAVDNPIGEKERSLAVAAAEKNSWAVKIEQMSALIEAMEQKKKLDREVSWSINLVKVYRSAGGRIIRFALAAAVVYAIIFHTPFVWQIAEPLRIHDAPERSDVIAALGGGVGETGKVSQGYQERVEAAVKLYKEGYANQILYSSGYKYIIKEADVMKTLSISFGVAPEDIMIDDVSADTYGMVLRLKELSQAGQWKRIIVVSSPYHMLRLKLLCDKHLKNTRVFYVPVEDSEFYARGRSIKPEQIKGIVQEYLAVVYYRVKGYI